MNSFKPYIYLFVLALAIASCRQGGKEKEEHEHEEEHAEEVHFSEQKFQTLNMKVDTLPVRNLSRYTEVNGQLKVPPQNNAVVTAVIGANIRSIQVREGDPVKKGQVLAYLSHPDLIRLQTDYVNNWNQLQFLEKEYKRQTRLLQEKIGSGKEQERISADYHAMQGTVNGLQSQLKLTGLNPEQVLKGPVLEQVPLPSPINGFVHEVQVKTGQYVSPETNLFEVINTDEIYAELMIFEKDLAQVKPGQQIECTIESQPGNNLQAIVKSIGKTFDPETKAVHIYAQIYGETSGLVPGMYVRGRIVSDDLKNYALPEEGVVREGDKFFIFMAEKETENGSAVWAFRPLEVIRGVQDNGWTEVKLMEQPPKNMLFAMNNAYYLLGELKKGETEHHH